MATLVACGSEPAGNATKVTYLTSFSTFGRDAYAYVAQEKGFFAEAGLDVRINPGSGTVDVLKLVAAIHQRTVAAIVGLEGGGVTTPAGLAGKTIGDPPARPSS